MPKRRIRGLRHFPRADNVQSKRPRPTGNPDTDRLRDGNLRKTGFLQEIPQNRDQHRHKRTGRPVRLGMAPGLKAGGKTRRPREFVRAKRQIERNYGSVQLPASRDRRGQDKMRFDTRRNGPEIRLKGRVLRGAFGQKFRC